MTGSPEKAVQVRMFMLISHIQLKPCNGAAFRNVRVSNPTLSAINFVSAIFQSVVPTLRKSRLLRNY